MPRPKTLEPKYRHHRRSGAAYVVIDGKEVWLGKHGTPASRKKYLATLTAVADPTRNPPVAMWPRFGRSQSPSRVLSPRMGTRRLLVAPLYAVALFFAVPPLRRLLARLKVWRTLRRAGLCPAC